MADSAWGSSHKHMTRYSKKTTNWLQSAEQKVLYICYSANADNFCRSLMTENNRFCSLASIVLDLPFSRTFNPAN